MAQPPQIAGKGGRPKRQFTEGEIEIMCKHALNGGQNNTIATAMNIPFNTLKRRFGKLLTQKRAERKLNLRKYQTEQSTNSSEMAKFLGKNELGQVDKQEIITEAIVQVEPLTDVEIKELKRLAALTSNIKIKPPEGLQGAG